MRFSTRICALFVVLYNPWSPWRSTRANTLSPVLPILREWHGDLMTCPGSSVKLIDNIQYQNGTGFSPLKFRQAVFQSSFNSGEKPYLLEQLLQNGLMAGACSTSISCLPVLVVNTKSWICLSFCRWWCCLVVFCNKVCISKENSCSPVGNTQALGEILGQQYRNAHVYIPYSIVIPWHSILAWLSETAVEQINNKLLLLAAAVRFFPAVTRLRQATFLEFHSNLHKWQNSS